AAVVLILALSIGANTAIFSVTRAALLQHIPWKNIDRLVHIDQRNQRLGIQRDVVSAADLDEWRDNHQLCEALSGWRFLYFNISGRAQPARVQGFKVDAKFLPLIGIAPALGRNFTPEETLAGRDNVAILTNGLWRRRFGADPGIIGQS